MLFWSKVKQDKKVTLVGKLLFFTALATPWEKRQWDFIRVGAEKKERESYKMRRKKMKFSMVHIHIRFKFWHREERKQNWDMLVSVGVGRENKGRIFPHQFRQTRKQEDNIGEFLLPLAFSHTHKYIFYNGIYLKIFFLLTCNIKKTS